MKVSGISVIILILFFASSVSTQTVELETSFNFPDFGSTAGLNLVGDTASFNNVLRITPSKQSQVGAAWYNTKQLVQDGFSTTFQFRVTQLGYTGADGFAFVIQNDSVSALGPDGSGMGYGDWSGLNRGIPNSLAVEFDTFRLFDGDPNGNHIAVHTRGSAPNLILLSSRLGITTQTPNMSDGNIHTVKIDYEPGIMTIYMDDLNNPVLIVYVDLANCLNLDSGKSFVGFTAATGGEYENHDILSWSFNTTIQNHPPIADAGGNLSIDSDEIQNTIIIGTATDEDPDDILQYRWKEGETILLDWTSAAGNGECALELSTVSIGIGTHTLTLEVSDGQAGSLDKMILTIENSAPHVAPSGSGIYEINTNVTLGGYVSDYDGDLLIFQWHEGAIVLFTGSIQAVPDGIPVSLPDFVTSSFGLGVHNIALQVDDGINPPVSSFIKVEIVDNSVPTLAPVADKTLLWPPNHEMTDLIIEANASDNSGLPVTLTAFVFSDEPADGLGDGDMSPDWTEPIIDQDNGIITLQLRAERSGSGDGRIYTVSITATDQSGNSSTVNIEIIVPHDKKKK